jgi:hypothetical protein
MILLNRNTGRFEPKLSPIRRHGGLAIRKRSVRPVPPLPVKAEATRFVSSPAKTETEIEVDYQIVKDHSVQQQAKPCRSTAEHIILAYHRHPSMAAGEICSDFFQGPNAPWATHVSPTRGSLKTPVT